MKQLVANLPTLEVAGKIVRMQAWRGDTLVGVYPADPKTRKRLSSTKIKQMKLYFKEHFGVFDKSEVDIQVRIGNTHEYTTEKKTVYKEAEPYITFKLERVFS